MDIDNKNPLPAEGEIKIKTRKKRTITPIILSPDATNIAYATHDGGAFKLFVKKIETGKKKKILRGGFKSDNYPHDNSYPQIAFSQNGGTLGICYERRDKIKFLQYDLETKKVTKHRLDNFQRINDFSFTAIQMTFYLAQLNGKTDIYLFSPKFREETYPLPTIFGMTSTYIRKYKWSRRCFVCFQQKHRYPFAIAFGYCTADWYI
ncbi:MAG: hypothetical protein IPN09_14465 [Bacteroidetes bacterium]|nr:hypothetical protein [Bacteroidota bacterium]